MQLKQLKRNVKIQKSLKIVNKIYLKLRNKINNN